MQQKQQHHLFQPHAFFSPPSKRGGYFPRCNSPVVYLRDQWEWEKFHLESLASSWAEWTGLQRSFELQRLFQGCSLQHQKMQFIRPHKEKAFWFFWFFWVSQSHIFRRPIKILQCPFCSNGSFLAFKANTLKIPESRQIKRLRWVYKMQCEQVTPCKNMIAFMGKAQSSLAPAEIWLAPEVPLLRYCNKKKCFEY